MRFKKRPQLPGAGRTRAGHHHGSHTPTSPGTILLGKMAYYTKQIRRECSSLLMGNLLFIYCDLFNQNLLRLNKKWFKALIEKSFDEIRKTKQNFGL